MNYLVKSACGRTNLWNK